MSISNTTPFFWSLVSNHTKAYEKYFWFSKFPLKWDSERKIIKIESVLKHKDFCLRNILMLCGICLNRRFGNDFFRGINCFPAGQ